jgi:hypothetical protein
VKHFLRELGMCWTETGISSFLKQVVLPFRDVWATDEHNEERILMPLAHG